LDNPSWRYHERFNDVEKTPVLDELIPAIFEAIDTYYEERSDAKIRILLITGVRNGLLQELGKLADMRG
jgi:hypothetical protein